MVYWKRVGLIISVVVFLSSNNLFASYKEARAVWLSRFEYSSRYMSQNEQKAFIRRAIKNLKQANFNMLIFQVRGQADAFYRSNFEPWSDRLTGELGQDPGWDPLQYAINQAHANSIELHAWVNAYPCWKGSSPPSSNASPQHVYWQHPEWFCVDQAGNPMPLGGDNYITLSPGIPEVREYIKNVCMDIVLNYDIDGLHFDYIRYPQQNYSYDPISDSLFNDPVNGNPNGLSHAGWQREQVNIFVREIYDQIMAVKPMLKISAAVIGKYKYDFTYWTGYYTVYQDGAQWTAEGKTDFLAPMMYWPIGQLNPWAPFEILARDWVYNNSNGRHIYGGIGAYKNLDNFPEIAAEIDTLRKIRAEGAVFFSYSSLEYSSFWDDLLQRHYKLLANVPAMPWKDDVPPNKPNDLQVSWVTPTSIELHWQPPEPAEDGDVADYYNIYRSVNRSPLDVEDPKFLYAITPDNQTFYVDNNVDSSNVYFYWVSALDKNDNEGPITRNVQVTVENFDISELPLNFQLQANYPNPFNSSTHIEYHIPPALDGEQVSLTIVDVLGRRVKNIFENQQRKGSHRATWDGKDNFGNQVASGTYFVLLKAKGHISQNKILLLR